MRITQHKVTHSERPAKDAEDVTGLTVSSRLVLLLSHMFVTYNTQYN